VVITYISQPQEATTFPFETGGHTFEEADIRRCMDAEAWLSDKNVNEYMLILNERNRQKMYYYCNYALAAYHTTHYHYYELFTSSSPPYTTTSGAPRVHCLSSFFFQRLFFKEVTPAGCGGSFLLILH
jgi:hypothetical protein